VAQPQVLVLVRARVPAREQGQGQEPMLQLAQVVVREPQLPEGEEAPPWQEAKTLPHFSRRQGGQQRFLTHAGQGKGPLHQKRDCAEQCQQREAELQGQTLQAPQRWRVAEGAHG
jgi:hypothetical protein